MARLSLPNGKRKYIYAATRQEVARQLAIAQRDKEQGLVATGPGQTVARYLKDWLENTTKNSVRVRTYECYELNVRRLIPHIGRLRLSALTPAHVQATYTVLLDGGISHRSVELAHAVLHRALRQAVQWGPRGTQRH